VVPAAWGELDWVTRWEPVQVQDQRRGRSLGEGGTSGVGGVTGWVGPGPMITGVGGASWKAGLPVWAEQQVGGARTHAHRGGWGLDEGGAAGVWMGLQGGWDVDQWPLSGRGQRSVGETRLWVGLGGGQGIRLVGGSLCWVGLGEVAIEVGGATL
jgi:hypothetical protein